MLLDENQQEMVLRALFNILVASGVIDPNSEPSPPMLVHIAEEYAQYLINDKILKGEMDTNCLITPSKVKGN